jgi:hypothetical protein
MFETAFCTWKIKTVDEASEDGTSFYTRHGDVFAVSCALLSLLLLPGGVVDGFWKRGREN